MLAFHAQGEFAATLGVHNHVQSIPFGVLEIAEGRILGIREKPTMTYPTNAGIYVLNPALLARVPRDTAYTIPALIEDCVARGEPVGAFPIDEEWLDIGRPHELQRARGEASS
jgi:NDP-sugar pyrophosphorylase family protein